MRRKRQGASQGTCDFGHRDKIAGLNPAVIKLERSIRLRFAGEDRDHARVRRIRVLTFAKDVEESKNQRRNLVIRMIKLDHLFGRMLLSGVKGLKPRRNLFLRERFTMIT